MKTNGQKEERTMNRKERRALRAHLGQSNHRTRVPMKLQPMSLEDDLRGERPMLALVDETLARVRDIVEGSGELETHMMAFVSGHASATECFIYLPELSTDYDKTLATSAFRGLCLKLNAFASLLVTEAWLLPEVVEDQDAWAGRFHEHPERRRCVLVSLEHRTLGARAWIAEITRDAEGKPKIGPFEERIDDGIERAKAPGRFAGFLSTPADAVLN